MVHGRARVGYISDPDLALDGVIFVPRIMSLAFGAIILLHGCMGGIW